MHVYALLVCFFFINLFSKTVSFFFLEVFPAADSVQNSSVLLGIKTLLAAK